MGNLSKELAGLWAARWRGSLVQPSRLSLLPKLPLSLPQQQWGWVHECSLHIQLLQEDAGGQEAPKGEHWEFCL